MRNDQCGISAIELLIVMCRDVGAEQSWGDARWRAERCRNRGNLRAVMLFQPIRLQALLTPVRTPHV
jgi:hypothetical protein